ncbi:MAG: (2Fe-2S)-binding protein [Spirochaetaceae bacterium]
MNVSFTLDGKKLTVSVPAEMPLSQLLREHSVSFRRFAPCGFGECGLCVVLFDDKPTLSCLLPMYRVAGGTVVTPQGLLDSPKVRPAELGLARAGIEPCDACAPALLVTMVALLSITPTPSDKELERYAASVKCDCLPTHRLARGMRFALEFDRKRSHGARRP